MKKISLLIGAFTSIAVLHTSLFAQEFPAQPNSPAYNPNASYDGPYKQNTWSISAHFGPAQFFGDLREYDFFPVTKNSDDSKSELSFQGGLSIHKQLSYLLGLRADVSTGQLKGMKRRLYNRYFIADFTDVALSATVNLKGLLMGPNKMKHWKIDGYVGFGHVWYDSKAYMLGQENLIRTTNGFRNDWTLPVGATINYEVSPRIDIGLDFRLTHTNSDVIDATWGGDYSTNPNDGQGINTLKNSRKGNSALDKYGYGSLVLTYKLGKKPLKVAKKNGKYSYNADQDGYYNLRYTDPKLLVKPPKILSLEEMDSIAKANRPEELDPRLLLDSDGDGVSDFFDKEPDSPAGSVVDGSGKVIDFDSYVKGGSATNLNCSEIFANIQFSSDKFTIEPEDRELLKKVASVMNQYGCRLQLTGHADRRSNDRYNLTLSRRRVEAVKSFLINDAGLLDSSKVITDHFGSFKPIADDSKDGLRKNRRVELKLLP